MSVEKVYADDRWDGDGSFVRCVTLFQWQGAWDFSRPIEVGAAEQSFLDKEHEPLFRDISTDIDRCLWTLWIPTFTVSWSRSFSPFGLKIESRWLLRDSRGSVWSIQDPSRKGTRWHCPALECLNTKELGL